MQSNRGENSTEVKEDNQTCLPEEIWYRTFTYLNCAELKKSSLVSKFFRRLSSDRFLLENASFSPLDYSQLFINNNQNNTYPIRDVKVDFNCKLLPISNDTLVITSGNNFLVFDMKNKKTNKLNGHNSTVTGLAKLSGELLITSSYGDVEMKVFDLNEKINIKTLKHNYVSHIAITTNKTLLSADCKFIYFWDVKEGELIRKIEETSVGGGIQINSLLCSGNKIIVAYDDYGYGSNKMGYIKLFNENGDYLHTFNNISREIKLCLLPNQKLAGVTEGRIFVWDLNNYQLLSEIEDNAISKNSRAFALKHGNIAITTPAYDDPRKLFIYDCNSGSKINELNIKHNQVAFSCMPDGRIVIADKNANLNTINFKPALKLEVLPCLEFRK